MSGYANVKVFGADQAVDIASPPASSLIAVTQAAKVFSVMIYNSAASDQWYMVFDATALPANGAVPKIPPVLVPSKSSGWIDWGDGRQFYNGVVVCNSTTDTTKTLGAADSWLSVNFRKTSSNA